MNKLDHLRDLLGDFVDYEQDNFSLQWKILHQGITTPIRLGESRPRLSLFLAESLGLPQPDVRFLNTSQVPSTLFQKHSYQSFLLLLFGDDVFEISLHHPDHPGLQPMQFAGHYLEYVLKQGVGNVVSQILKNNLHRPVTTDPELTQIQWTMHVRLLEPTQETSRAAFLKHLTLHANVRARAQELCNPVKLFAPLRRNKFNSEVKFIIQERLKLWNQTLPPNQKAHTFFDHTVPQLPLNFFGINDLYKLDPIAHNFCNPIDNEVLLTGQLGHFNNYRYHRLLTFNQKLLKILAQQNYI